MAVGRSSEALDDTAPHSLTELAAAEQCRWALEYAHTHRTKRALAWCLALPQSIYFSFGLFWLYRDTFVSDPLVITIAEAALIPLMTIGFVLCATSINLSGEASLPAWAIAWAIQIFGGAMGSWHYMQFAQPAQAAMHTIVAIGTISTLLYGLYIPRAKTVDWDLVLSDFLTNVRTASGGKTYPTTVFDYRDAEKIAAGWLRRFGYSDAEATPDGRDNGIDVYANGAIAQVKNWATKRVGIAEVQRLCGAAQSGQA